MKVDSIVQVIFPTGLPRPFDYIVPPTMPSILIGQRVLVPFGKRNKVGLVIQKLTHSAVKPERLKPIIQIVDDKPLVDHQLLEFYRWASDYYHFPLAKVIFSALPKSWREEKIVVFEGPQTTSCHTVSSIHYSLTEEQSHAIATICQAQKYQTFLLAGVTGSGKTEVYLQCIDSILQQKKQALVLVPEIGLTPQTLTRFNQRFPQTAIAVLHSGLSPAKREQAYQMAMNGSAAIVIGTRSAIFIPMLNLGMIILDEEHDLSFKQQANLRYSARDLAVVRGRLYDVPVVLGSATPSIESWHNAEQKRYTLLSLSKRVGVELPVVNVLDLRQQELVGSMCQELLQKIALHLEAKNQVMLFINRRGYAPVLLCHHCGWMVSCAHCDARMTLHYKPFRLYCHHCGAAQTPPRICQQCKQMELMPIGVGTEQIETVLAQHFPQHSILRIDRDNVTSKKRLSEALTEAHSGEANILIGTQMLAKGHHFHRLTLVAVIDADAGLFSSDFRATERMAQLILQVAGRAGREEKRGEVFIQTHHPQHPLLLSLVNHDYFSYIKKIMTERKQVELPPFTYLALIRAEAETQTLSYSFLEEVKKSILSLQQSAIKIFGPVSAVMERKANRYRAQLLLQTKNRTLLQQTLHVLVSKMQQNKPTTKVRWSLDVDPLEME